MANSNLRNFSINGSTVVILVCVLIFVLWRFLSPSAPSEKKSIMDASIEVNNETSIKIDNLEKKIDNLGQELIKQSEKSNKLILLYTKENELLMDQLLDSKNTSDVVKEDINRIRTELDEINKQNPVDTFPIFH